MSLKDLNRRHLTLIGLYSTRYAVRGGAGLVFLLLVMVVGLLVANAVIQPFELAERELKKDNPEGIEKEQLIEALVDVAKPFVAWAIGERESVPLPGADDDQEDPWASYLLEERPALLSAVLLILLFMLPFLSVLGSFNQYSGDVGTRGIRFQLLRTERANIYFGRYLGTVFYFSLALALLLFTIVLYMGFKLEFYGWGELIGWGFWGWVSLSLLAVPYVAVCGWISGAIDSPFAALVVCGLVVIGPPLFALTAGLKWEHAHYVAYVKYLLPWATQNYLLHHSNLYVLLGVGACLGYAAVFLGLGYRHFAKRDL